MKASALVLTDANFDNITGRGVVLVDFWAPRCGPCRQQLPIVEEVAEAMFGKAVVGKCNVDEESRSPERFDLKQIPTLILLRDNREVERFVGLQSKALLLAALKKHIE